MLGALLDRRRRADCLGRSAVLRGPASWWPGQASTGACSELECVAADARVVDAPQLAQPPRWAAAERMAAPAPSDTSRADLGFAFGAHGRPWGA
eukprot:9289156-Pyramimonas_sp.AAC.1